MHLRQSLIGIGDRIDRAFGRSEHGEEVRAQLYGTLYSRMLSIILGSACAIASGWTCALATGDGDITVLAAILTTLALLRMAHALLMERRQNAAVTRAINVLFPAITLGFALSLGLIAALTMLGNGSAETKVLAVVSAVSFGTALALRCAGCPRIALSQIICAFLPIFVACLMLGSLPVLVLALILPCLGGGMAALTLSTFRNLAERIEIAHATQRYAEDMYRQARMDPVTGLPNRTGFGEELARLIDGFCADEKLVLMWIDLHRFKEINDVLGHAAGDTVLHTVAGRLRDAAPDGAAIGRFASDEFIVAAAVPSRVAAQQLAELIAETTAQPQRIDGHRIEGGASMGVALMPDDADNAERLMQAADLALYNAKRAGGTAHLCFDEVMTRELARKKEIESELRTALQRDELSIYFQPIYDLNTGRIRSFEALVRWFHPEKGELHPSEFIPVAEATGLIITLGNWITAQAAQVASGWPEDVTLAVNLSPTQIKAPGAALGILAALAESRLDPARLELEVTETLFIDDDANTTAFMAELASRGVRFALDDFGTGYSSLRYIHLHPFRTIKVDRSFVSGVNSGARSDAIIRAVAEMGQTLGMEIVAEGLETIDQVRNVQAAGCTLGQGWYFSRAVPAFAAALLLEEEATGLADLGMPAERRKAG